MHEEFFGLHIYLLILWRCVNANDKNTANV